MTVREIRSKNGVHRLFLKFRGGEGREWGEEEVVLEK